MPWPVTVLLLFAGTLVLMGVTGLALALLASLYKRLGNPGNLIHESRKPWPGEGYYVEPHDD